MTFYRFGLYGHPFDADLFDTDLPIALKQSIIPTTTTNYATAVSCSTTASNNNNNQATPTLIADEMDYYDLFNPPSEKSSKAQLDFARSNIFGLLEVEPLHFSCHSTSDGTKMERLDMATPGYFTTMSSSGMSGTINFGETMSIPPQPTSSGAYTLTPWSTGLESTQPSQKQGVKSYLSNHIKQILSEVNKTISQDSTAVVKSISDQLLPPTPKTTPMVMTPPLTPPNESWQQVLVCVDISFI